ncbi:hypothetical protein [Streptomyces sp. DSM 41013]
MSTHHTTALMPWLVRPEQAAAEMVASSYEPLEPFPGTLTAPWQSRCVICGAARNPSLAAIRKGRRCAHRGARVIARAVGVTPAIIYMGRVETWKAKCWTCGTERRLAEHATTAQEFAAELSRAGFEESSTNDDGTWRMRCALCDAVHLVTLEPERIIPQRTARAERPQRATKQRQQRRWTGPDPEATAWSAKDCADYLGISTNSWRAAVKSGRAPQPDQFVKARTSMWDPKTVQSWEDED